MSRQLLERATLFSGLRVGEEARSVKQAAAELRRQGRTGSLHFKIDGAGQPVAMSQSQCAHAEVRGLLAELAKAKQPWLIEALHKKIKLASLDF